MVGLGNVYNTNDANKPVSTATSSALALKAPLASPTFTGTVSGVSSTMVGLGNCNNTSDANKPISAAMQTALDGKEPAFDAIAPSQKGVNLGSGHWELKLASNLGNILVDNLYLSATNVATNSINEIGRAHV